MGKIFPSTVSSGRDWDGYDEDDTLIPRSPRMFIPCLPSDTSTQYWLGGSPENVESLLLNLARSYVPEVSSQDSVKDTVSLLVRYQTREAVVVRAGHAAHVVGSLTVIVHLVAGYRGACPSS